MIVAAIQPKIGETSGKNHFFKMKRDIGMAKYENNGNIPHPVIFVELLQDSEAWEAKI